MKRFLIAAAALLTAFILPGPVAAQDCTAHLCGLSASTMTGLRNTFVDGLNTETIAGAKTFSDDVTLSGSDLIIGDGTPGVTQDGEDAYIEGTLEVDGASQFDGSVDATGGFSISGTTVDATALEINAVADLTARVVTLTGDTSITVATHEGRLILLGEVGGDAKLSATLPEATGSGAIFKFIISVANTAEYEIQVATDDIFDGYMMIIDGNLQTTLNVVADYTSATADTLNMDSDLICGDVGDHVTVTDILTGIWAVSGTCRSDGDAYTTVWAAEQS